MLTILLTDVRLLLLIRRDRRVDGRRGRYCILFSMSIPPSLLSDGRSQPLTDAERVLQAPDSLGGWALTTQPS